MHIAATASIAMCQRRMPITINARLAQQTARHAQSMPRVLQPVTHVATVMSICMGLSDTILVKPARMITSPVERSLATLVPAAVDPIHTADILLMLPGYTVDRGRHQQHQLQPQEAQHQLQQHQLQPQEAQHQLQPQQQEEEAQPRQRATTIRISPAVLPGLGVALSIYTLARATAVVMMAGSTLLLLMGTRNAAYSAEPLHEDYCPSGWIVGNRGAWCPERSAGTPGGLQRQCKCPLLYVQNGPEAMMGTPVLLPWWFLVSQ